MAKYVSLRTLNPVRKNPDFLAKIEGGQSRQLLHIADANLPEYHSRGHPVYLLTGLLSRATFFIKHPAYDES